MQLLDQLKSEGHVHAVGTIAKTCEVPIKVEPGGTTIGFDTSELY